MKRLLLAASIALAFSACGGCTDKADDDCRDQGCFCETDSHCNTGLECDEGSCEEPRCDALGNCIPDDPTCYSPCRGPVYSADGRVRECSSEGLLEGCLSDAVCDEGTCVPKLMAEQRQVASSRASKLGKCEADVDCPDYQTCMRGQCVSTCETDGDCAAGAQCVRTVCRATCTETELCTEPGFICVGGDCLPAVEASDPSGLDVDGKFTLSTDRVDFSGGREEGSFTITNESSVAQVFTVRKSVERVGSDIVRAADGQIPLLWLSIDGQPATSAQAQVVVRQGDTVEVAVGGARKDGVTRWTGELEVEHPTLGSQLVKLSYSEDLDGHWTGRVFAFGTFDDGNRPNLSRRPLDEWVANRQDTSLVDDVPNAFLQAWARFRNNALSLEEWNALASATMKNTWQSARVRELCADAGFGAAAACAPFGGAGADSVLLYSADASVNRIPTGIVELDFAMDIRRATPNEVDGIAACNGLETCFVGRLDTENALQYGANPQLVLTMDGEASDCVQGPQGCVATMASLDATIGVGGRYRPADGETQCAARPEMAMSEVPWLVRAFAPAGVKPGVGGEQRTRVMCSDGALPFANADDNRSYSAANPIPDGMSRVRHLSLVDALVYEQNQMLMLVKEEIEPLVPGMPPLTSYAYIALEKQPEEPDPSTILGAPINDSRAPAPAEILEPACPDWLVTKVVGRPSDGSLDRLNHDEITRVARAAVRGDSASIGYSPLTTRDTGEEVHYVCIWDEQAVIDNQPVTIRREVIDAGPAGIIPCPPGARVVYFALDPTDFGIGYDPARLACNQTVPEKCLGNLDPTLTSVSDWVTQGRGIRLMQRDQSLFASPASSVTFDLVARCSDPVRASCDEDRFDLRSAKEFLAGGQPEVFFSSIETEILDAFAYRTQFSSRTGTNVGFAPTVCEGGANLTPYCYDPALIERLVSRVDCALAIYDEHLQRGVFQPATNQEDARTVATLRQYLDKNFAQLQTYNPNGDPVLEHGFERLYAELLILLGDEAYVGAFASRFDIAGQSQLAFDGDRFEPGGIALSGGAGFEMYSLYQATQYYEMALDRFYRLIPVLWRALQAPAGAGYVSQRTVTSYLERVTRASTQNTAAWSEIGARYQALNRADLARNVLARAYTRTHQESVILSAFMTEVQRTVNASELDQVVVAIDDAQRRYRVSLLEMSQTYARLTDEQNYFGLPTDLVPFPALDDDSANAFEVMFERAQGTAETAAEYEADAIGQRRDFDTDTEAFQAELVQLRQDYEAELGTICGTFVGQDGRVYPAIVRYAHLDPDLAKLADPCGAAGNGDLWSKASDLQTAYLDLQRVRQELKNSGDEFKDAIEHVRVQCRLIREDRDAFIENQGAIDSVQDTIDRLELGLSISDKIFNATTKVFDFVADTKFGFITPYVLVSLAHFATTVGLEGAIVTKQKQIRDRERAYEGKVIERQCDYLETELIYTLRAIQRDIDLGELDVLNATWNIQAELSELQRLNNERLRLETAWADTEQLTINVAAAQNDPNVRIFKNDAIINSDRTFRRALRDAYRATRVYEYYTATSYADFEQLFLIRLVTAGDYNLASYLANLEEAFFDFENINGNPDTRVAQVSVKNDILKIPRYSTDGENRVLTARERSELLRDKLQSPSLLDPDGHISLDFSTTFDGLSPLTANHKILFIEVEMYGEELGDNVGRIYLRQKGTGVVRPLDGDDSFYAFPPATAVMNPIFNGDRSFGQDADGAIAGPTRSIFRSFRFRDRPLVQTQWQLVLNQRTEEVNTDINLGGIDDIVLTIFYTDFTRQGGGQ